MTDYHFCFSTEALAHIELTEVLDGYSESVSGEERIVEGDGWAVHLLPVLRKRGAYDADTGSYAWTTKQGYHVNLRVMASTKALNAMRLVHGVNLSTPLRVWQ